MSKRTKKILASLAIIIVVLYILAAHTDVLRNLGLYNPDKGTPDNTAVVTQLNSETLQAGYGDTVVKPGDLIAVNYIGALENGAIFNSNLSTGIPFEVYIDKGAAPKGWDEALIGMRVGEKRKLTVPPEFGDNGVDMENAPANAVLIYEVELLEIK